MYFAAQQDEFTRGGGKSFAGKELARLGAAKALGERPFEPRARQSAPARGLHD
jgi:hypothetical protein